MWSRNIIRKEGTEWVSTERRNYGNRFVCITQCDTYIHLNLYYAVRPAGWPFFSSVLLSGFIFSFSDMVWITMFWARLSSHGRQLWISIVIWIMYVHCTVPYSVCMYVYVYLSTETKLITSFHSIKLVGAIFRKILLCCIPLNFMSKYLICWYLY